MLKSTYKSQRPVAETAPLPPDWSEHTAPTGHRYYYNLTTKQSTYTRPTISSHTTGQQFLDANNLHHGFNQPQSSTPSIHSFGDSSTFGSYQGRGQNRHRGRGDHGGGHGRSIQSGHQPEDRPKSKHPIPGCAPWVLVKTKLGRRFVHNTEDGLSLWKFPTEVMMGVVEYDRIEREKRAAGGKGRDEVSVDENIVEAEEIAAAEAEASQESIEVGQPPIRPAEDPTAQGEDSDGYGYEEVEVTDDEDQEADIDEDKENPTKRQKVNEAQDGPVEFDEDDIAYQLAAMGQDYGLDPGEYGNAEDEEWEEGAEGLPLTEEDSKALFKDLLDDLGINPYNTWEKIIEEGRIVEDDRYTILPNMKSRKEVWGEWSREKAQNLKEQREKQEKKDPRIPYLAFLQRNASPKLYWPEFKRKYKKEAEMRDSKLSDKDREKWYRDYINRLKLPQSTLKSDLSTLLKSTPLSTLNRSTIPTSLPPNILTDIRYISLASTIRDPLIEAYISTLPLAPSQSNLLPEEDEEHVRKRQERERRERALEEREQRVREEKRRQNGAIEHGREVLKEGEMEIERALKVGKGGLRAQLRADEIGHG